MLVSEAQRVFEELTHGLPRFKDGRVDFTGVRKAPVINVVVYWSGKILLVKRSREVITYKGFWNGISGFIDELKPLEEFAKQEVREELSLATSLIKQVITCKPYEVDDKNVNRVWVVYPVLVELKAKPKITLDWEHTEYVWIKPAELTRYRHVKDFDKSVKRALARL